MFVLIFFISTLKLIVNMNLFLFLFLFWGVGGGDSNYIAFREEKTFTLIINTIFIHGSKNHEENGSNLQDVDYQEKPC